MPEINSQSDHRLTEALRHMAASSPQCAPVEIGAGLVTAFRRHHTRRRRIRLAGIAGLVASLALVAGVMFMRTALRKADIEQARHAITNVPGKAPETQAVVKQAAAATARPRATGKRMHAKATTAQTTAARQFLALPGYDPAVPADELHVVRVQLPASALWQMGAPMSADGDGRRVLADFVVSQDGTPYAVRLVQ